ncbi:cell wall anchor protein [Pseudaminobacter sp. NGMCC 1.201702]|uniref:cell wall anchor protein n=1 Tax=Pseudaminobacter sp. NGMCC 1.201702 TaxID=3391825 RepID=UPI0039F114B1
MRMLLFVAAAMLALAGCQTTSIDVAIQKNLPQVCSAAGTAHVAFIAASAAGTISDRTIRKEAAAWAALEPICANPSGQTTATILVAAASAYATITIALREAGG